MKFRKKPFEIEAIQWDGTENSLKAIEAMGCYPVQDEGCVGEEIIIPTLEDGELKSAKHVASIGDYIIRGIKGEFYPCKPDIFEMTYDKA